MYQSYIPWFYAMLYVSPGGPAVFDICPRFKIVPTDFVFCSFFHNFFNMYRVTRQCCPGGNRPETPRRPSAGGLRIFWAKSLVITAIYTNLSLNFVYMAGITSDLAQKIRRPPAEGLRGVSGQFPPGQH